MSALSKEVFNKAVQGKKCNEFIHPWAQSCVRGIYDMIISSLLGSAKFSFALSLVCISLNIF